MRRLLIASLIFILLTACVSKSEQQAKQLGNEIYFAQTTIDYGQIREGSEGLYNIEFKNLADHPIVINRVRSSCGCTVPSWSREPIEPGSGGKIQVKYNTELTGSFMKSVYVYSSAANSPVKLTVKGKVLPVDKSE